MFSYIIHMQDALIDIVECKIVMQKRELFKTGYYILYYIVFKLIKEIVR